MERSVIRKPFQGIANIIRFNWHYYVIAIAAIIALVILRNYVSELVAVIITIFLLLIIASIIVSLFISWYIYDCSNLYTFCWLDNLNILNQGRMVNINAGFDESSDVLKIKYPAANLLVFDFYDPKKHTEISIERARKACPPFPGTITTETDKIPLEVNSVETIFLILAAHEIRNDKERIYFFNQLKNSLSQNGKIIVAEHQRDIFNFIAYNFGSFHFLSSNTWIKTFKAAGLSEKSTFKITPFIKGFVLSKNGTAS